jgi:hypothetical protein
VSLLLDYASKNGASSRCCSGDFFTKEIRRLLHGGETFDEVFGQRPFSRHSFTRCLIIGPLLLGACLGVYGLWLKLPFAMHNLPWVSYRESLEMLKKAAADPKTKAGAESVWQNLRDLSQLNGWTYEAIYTIYFLLVVIAVITVLLWLNLGISRLFLREIAGTKTLFAALS